jgi:hypothetical protein
LRTTRTDTPVLPDPPVRRGRPWRPVDELVLRALVHGRVAPDELARRLGREPADVHAHLVRLGLA